MALTQGVSVEEAAATPAVSGVEADDPLLDCLAILTRLHGRPVSSEALAAGLPLEDHRLTPALFVRAAERNEYSARVLRRAISRISNLVLPAVLLMKDGGACVLTGLLRGGQAEVVLPEAGFGAKTVSVSELRKLYSGYCIFVQPRPRPDQRMGDAGPSPAGSWFWGTLWRFKRYYLEAMAAAALINLLAVATALFVMNVYDRVIPNNAVETLLVLATGVLIAVGFEFMARTMRGYFIDVTGKKADLLLASKLFEQALAIPMEHRPRSAGAFAAHIREFESLRDFFTSAALTTMSDLPFIFFFIWVISLIGGPLYVVPLAAVAIVVTAGLIAQIPLARLMRRHMRETALRHGLLVEAVEGVETLKAVSAEGTMQRRWENYTALTGETSTRSRLVSAFVINFTVFVQQSVTVGVVVWGVFLIAEGALTVGGLIACVIIGGRALAPMGQVAALLVRYQQARTAYFMLDGLMHLPVERPPGRSYLHRPEIKGAVEFSGVSFSYPEQQVPALRDVSLTIRAGEHVAILGRIGSGKSTLLKLAVGLYRPAAGSILLDGADLQQFDPVDVRHRVGYLSQDVRLFHGTLRENVVISAPLADEGQILAAAGAAGLDRLVDRNPMGFDMLVSEGGEGLSGGQRQAVGIARTLLMSPAVLLLDEPTSSMDHNSEQAFISHMKEFIKGRTFLLVTHKPTMLELADRIVVLDGGRVVTDGPRDAVLKSLTQPQPSAVTSPAEPGAKRPH